MTSVDSLPRQDPILVPLDCKSSTLHGTATLEEFLSFAHKWLNKLVAE